MPKFNEVMGNIDTKIEETAKQEPAKKAITQMPKEKPMKTPKADPKKLWGLYDEWEKKAFAEQTPENIEKGNKAADDLYGEFIKHLTPKQQDEFDTVFGTFKHPDEVTEYMEKIIGKRPKEELYFPKTEEKKKPDFYFPREKKKNPDEDEILRESFDGDFIAKLRAEDADNMERRGDKKAASYIRNMSHKEVVDHYIDNYGIDKLKKLAEERNGINQDRVNLLSKGKPLAELREKYSKKILKPSSGNYWLYEDPDTKYMTRLPSEIDALRYAEQKEELHQKWVANEGERLLSEFKKGNVSPKELKQFGRSQYAADIIAYLLNRIK